MKEENKKKEIRSCKICNGEFEVNLRNKREIGKIFCSRVCSGRNNGQNGKGRIYSDEVNKKKGRKGELNSFFGKSHSEESKTKMSEASKWDDSKFRYCNLSDEEKEVLDGLLLSDGCLSEKSRISARLTFGFKFKETPEEIFKELHSIEFGPIWQSEHTKCYHSKSNMYHDLLNENKRWYPKKEKIVPRDILITPKSCYWWFIGDGYTTNGNVYLCTDSFTKEDNQFLIEKLNKKGFKPSITSKNRIRFDKKDTIAFLKWITPEKGIMEQYKYKWEI